MRSVSSTFSSSSWNGSGGLVETTSSSSTWSSTSPVGRFGLTFSGARAATSPGRAEDELVPDVVRGRGRLGRALRVDDELADPRRVAEVDEDEPAVVAAPRDPAGERVALADVVGPELARSEVAPAHSDFTASASDGNSTSSRLPAADRRAVGAHDHRRLAPTRPACVSWPLQRPARVVRVGSASGTRRSSAIAASTFGRASVVLDREEDVDLGCAGSTPCSREREDEPLDARSRIPTAGVGGPPISSIR